ncbi:hypothetical protein KCP73_10595 [Salmonella enterica subsp. enterica]|nr:hypothetical protein KCP73_10595 [Salmonella enterica subsp. enterica]
MPPWFWMQGLYASIIISRRAGVIRKHRSPAGPFLLANRRAVPRRQQLHTHRRAERGELLWANSMIPALSGNTEDGALTDWTTLLHGKSTGFDDYRRSVS